MLALGAAGALGAKKLLDRKKRSATAKPQDVTMKGMKATGFGKNIIEMYKKQKLGTPGIAGPVMRRGGILKADKGKIIRKDPTRAINRVGVKDRYGMDIKPKTSQLGKDLASQAAKAWFAQIKNDRSNEIADSLKLIPGQNSMKLGG